ncbi:hypothetical protein ACJMK2_003573 [Sinanodonta woodiana]|uniref:Uncharacterized protein n=1 Tax=Sinanodonta woodiana TaxID=1069815 RepID=A0ABD3Y1N2_SINWO
MRRYKPDEETEGDTFNIVEGGEMTGKRERRGSFQISREERLGKVAIESPENRSGKEEKSLKMRTITDITSDLGPEDITKGNIYMDTLFTSKVISD